MEIIRKKAVAELKLANPPLDPVDQIIAARRYHCTELVETPMGVLVRRKEPLTFEEMLKLPPEDLHNWIKERDISQGRPCRNYVDGNGYCTRCGVYH